MDPQTVEFYERHGAEVAADYAKVKSPAAKYFPVAFLAGSRVLDIGCGMGRDTAALVEAGFDATGVDASETMLQQARERYPDLAARLNRDSVPALSTVGDAAFDGVLCWAVLMHLPEELLFDTIYNLRRVLKPGGRLLISTPLSGPTTDPKTLRDSSQRLFNGITPENFQFLLEKVGFKLLNRWNEGDSLGRSERTWAIMLFVLEGEGSRSLDKIESILNRDKKDATYKLALFRALAELATTNYQCAIWTADGKVSLPLALIVDKWVEYYWPLFDSDNFIPQKRGEKRVCKKPIVFRTDLDNLIAFFRKQGGLSGYSLALRSGTLAGQALHLHSAARGQIAHAIKEGPMKYAGGPGSKTFGRGPGGRSILMESDLWRELSLMGHWIGDATILRWAELTSEISEGSIPPSQVIDQLLVSALPEREVSTAKTFYDRLTGKVCVWTDVSLEKKFDIDHAIPFALWRNNDLWNLLPVACAINNQKSDLLPSLSLVRSRKDCFVHYWTQLREAHRHRFDFEASRLVGDRLGENWENRLFGAVVEGVEFTAIQRGIRRWEPTPKAIPKLPLEEGPALEFVENPPEEERFVCWVPFYDIATAAGRFGPDQSAFEPGDYSSWVRLVKQKLDRDLFAIRVVGKSMEPKIPDGSICLFRRGEARVGSRQGRIVLVALRDSVDPETGGKLTVKLYESEKKFDAEGNFEHTRITLKPLNKDFAAIELDPGLEGSYAVLGEFVEVIGPGPRG